MKRDAVPLRSGPGLSTPGLRKDARAGQARTGHAGLLWVWFLALPLAACIGSPAETPFEFFRQLTGDPLQGRRTPAGLEAPRPNFSVVPARPDRGPAEIRAELSASLAANRAAAATPAPVGLPVPARPQTEGAAAIPEAPPPPPRLAAAPPVGTGPATLTLPGSRSTPGTPAAVVPEIGSVPAPPPAELTAPAAPNLSAPPPPPRL